MKNIFGILTILFMTTAVVYWAVDGMNFELKDKQVSTNDTTYVWLFLTDENQQPVTDVEPIITATPSYPVELWNFVHCDSAEWQEFCINLDATYAGLRWVYVAEIKTKDVDENVKLTVLSDSTDNAKIHVEELIIGQWASETIVETIEDVPAVWWNNIKWLPILFAILILGIFTFTFVLRKN